MLHVVRWADAVDVPWRNGGGVTRELIVQGDDPFDWRLSAATIDRDGPFSEFAGIDRILVLLRGDGIDLELGGRSVTLTAPGQGVVFSGEVPVAARLLGGSTVDLNLMWRRDRWRASYWSGDLCAVLPCASADATTLTVLYVVEGEAVTTTDGSVSAGDTLWWRGVTVPDIKGDATVVRFCLERGG